MGKFRTRVDNVLRFDPKQNDRAKVKRYYLDWRAQYGPRERCDNRVCVFYSAQLEWNKKPLRMILDHINGNFHDNRVENLRLVCPNCNSQLETAGGGNIGRIQKETEGGFEVAHRDGRRDALVAPSGVSLSSQLGSVKGTAGGTEKTQRIATAVHIADFTSGDQSMNRMNPKVDTFLSKAKKWRQEFEALRTIVLGCGLTEDFKWMHPCYTFEEKNIVVIHGFKEYCALLFFKGALLKDAKGILIQQTPNVQSGRQIRFTSVREIAKLERTLKAYVFEAVEVEKAGLKVKLKKTSDYKVPEEFQTKLKASPALKAAFEALTPGRQRAYFYYFSQAKQSKTRTARVEKYAPQILSGKGLND